MILYVTRPVLSWHDVPSDVENNELLSYGACKAVLDDFTDRG